jgi:hypothetical protein
MSRLGHTEILRAVMRSCGYLNPESKGGAHADVLAIDGERLAVELLHLARVRAGSPFAAEMREMARRLAARFIVKKGKVEDLAMQVIGSQDNRVPRARVAHAFGPFGFNVHPTIEKVIIDAKEAVRQLPYFAVGPEERVLAPDVLGQLGQALNQRCIPERFLKPESDTFLYFLDQPGTALERSVYSLLDEDRYFRGSIRNFRELAKFQRFVRGNPLTREMEDALQAFFQAPITVGVWDTIRFAMGSRHPELGWEKARQAIQQCFENQKKESFVPPELNYYAFDVAMPADRQAAIAAVNDRVVGLFCGPLQDALAKQGFHGFERSLLRRLAYQILDFHHGYALYEIEAYQGLASTSTLKLLGRFLGDLFLVLTKIEVQEKKNRNLVWLKRRPGTLLELLASQPNETRAKFLKGIEQALADYVARGGVRDEAGNVHPFRRLDKTFYSFQERADYHAAQRGRVEETLTMARLNSAHGRELLRAVPELAEKLAVFYTLSLRYYRDTGFMPDLRPKNIGRDLFLFGIWGYVTENLLVTLWRDARGERRADLSFVDNKDQFKDYRRIEDQDEPLGMAKNALRLTRYLGEPALLRSIGMFTEWAACNRSGTEPTRTPVFEKLTTRGLSMAQEVAHKTVDTAFDSAKTTVEDAVDDFFKGVRRTLRR